MSTIVISIEAKLKSDNQWEVYVEGGREKTGLDVSDWATKVEKLGAGEILLTSVDREGTRKGYDINLIKSVTQKVNIPVVASGGMGKPEDLVEAVKNGEADAVSMADILHYDRINFKDIRKVAIKNNINTRKFNE